MKYYSDVTKEKYDTVEALEKAEAEAQAKAVQTADKQPKEVALSERKEAAKRVEKAFAVASQKRKENANKREELEDKIAAIEEKYDEKYRTCQKEFDAQCEVLELKRREETAVINKECKELEKADKAILEEAYAELRAFCKKYGTYHYSVDAAGAELFPMLMGFGQVEKAQNAFRDIFGSIFNLF